MKFYILVISLIICHGQLPEEPPPKFALLTVTYARNYSFETIQDYLKTYAESQCHEKLISEICIIWNNKQLPEQVGVLDRQLYWRVPVYFFVTKNNSLNHRFRVPKEATADVFYSLDDDIRVDCNTLNITYMHFWKAQKVNPNRFVGNQVRSFGFLTSKRNEFYYQGQSYASHFAVSETGATFFPRHYLDLYYLKLEELEKLRQKVDSITSCQDIFFMAISQHFHPEMAPEFYKPQKEYHNTDPKVGLSRKKGLVPLRTGCITFLTDTLGYNPLRIYSKNASKYAKNWEFKNLELIMQMKIRGLNSVEMIQVSESEKGFPDSSLQSVVQQQHQGLPANQDRKDDYYSEIKQLVNLPQQRVTYRPNKQFENDLNTNNQQHLNVQNEQKTNRTSSFFKHYRFQILIGLLIVVILILLICTIKLFRLYNQQKTVNYHSSPISPTAEQQESSIRSSPQ